MKTITLTQSIQCLNRFLFRGLCRENYFLVQSLRTHGGPTEIFHTVDFSNLYLKCKCNINYLNLLVILLEKWTKGISIVSNFRASSNSEGKKRED